MLSIFAAVDTTWCQVNGDIKVPKDMECIGGNRDSCEGGSCKERLKVGNVVWMRKKTSAVEMTS